MALSLGQKAGWGLADLGIVVFVMVKGLLVFEFMASYLGVPAAAAGLITTSILVFDIITDPLIGYFSDRTQTKWGRRAPWIAIGVIVMTIGMVGMFAAPAAEGANWTPAVVWLGGFFVLATIGFTMAAIPYAATAGEMSDDPNERSVMLAWRMGFASLGILIGGGVVPMLAGGTHAGHLTAMFMISPLVIGSVWLSLFATRNAPRNDTPTTVHPKQMLKLVLGNKPFVVLVLFYGIMTLAIAQITTGMPLAAKYLIEGGNLVLLFAPFVVGAMISQVLWAWLSIRAGKVRAMTIGVCLYILMLMALYVVLPTQTLALAMGLMLLVGAANGAYQAIPWAIYPDLMDVTRAESGEAIEGGFSAVWLFGQKVANALAPGIFGMIIGAYGWKETTQGVVEQTPEALSALHWALTLMPAGIFVVALIVFVGIYRPMAARVLG
ncbi:MAG: MFS transporter [Planktomarina sp.]